MVFKGYTRMSEFPFSSNALHKARTHFALELHPSTVENVTEGVKDQLNANLLRYVEEFEGVLLSYSNLAILTRKPIIHPYFPFFHLNVRTDVLIFKPKPGMNLVGQVNLLGEDYISALVFGFLNVAIPARDVMKELHFLREEAKWIHTQQPQHQILENSYIVFKVEEVRNHGGYFQIAGSLRDHNTGALDFLHPGLELPGGPSPAWTADIGMVDGSADPGSGGEAYDFGRAGTTNEAVTTATEKPMERTRHGAVDIKGNGQSTRKRRGGVVEEPKGKRRRKEGEDAGADGLTPAPVATAYEIRSGKKMDKRLAKDGGEDEQKDKAKNDQRKEDKDGAKDKPSHHAAVSVTGAAEHADAMAAKAAVASTPRMTGLGTGDVHSNATASAGGEKQHDGKGAKKSSKKEAKEGKESSKKEAKEGKESSKKEAKEGKESSKKEAKEGKESSKKEAKEGKESSKKEAKEGKESSKKEAKEDKESSKKEAREGKESSKKEAKEDKESSKKEAREGKESSKKEAREGKESSKKEAKEGKESSKKEAKEGKESSKKEAKEGKESSKKEAKEGKESSKKDKHKAMEG
ncbi:hypothetical protein VaNZ11_009314 [Volvox africanus]|uniref:RPA43 OB domain-containing protein n=1 Tax=Volvox africanus TaxID=51714 RepID=A0ABQ5S718_9CHLO|nr:hypothetical protein VaNZ11_009314 [Volvox africanus]